MKGIFVNEDGCMNDADYYVDFLTTDNLKIVEVEGND